MPAASLAKQTTESAQGSPDVQLVYGGKSLCLLVGVLVVCMDVCVPIHFGTDLHNPTPSPSPPTTGLKRPNGLAFSPDFQTLYVANSDADDPKWVALDIDPRTGLQREAEAGQEPRLLASAKAFQREDGSRVGNP